MGLLLFNPPFQAFNYFFRLVNTGYVKFGLLHVLTPYLSVTSDRKPDLAVGFFCRLPLLVLKYDCRPGAFCQHLFIKFLHK